MPGPAGVIAASDLALLPVGDQKTIADRKDQAATDRPVSLKGAIHKNLSARASRFLRQRFGDPNLALLDPACPPCRRGLRPPAVPSEHMRVRPDPRAVLVKGAFEAGGCAGGEARQSRVPAGRGVKRTPRLPEPEFNVSI
ncbi:hypothetical protein PM04_15610 [Thalassobacter sp. 16PALIMAR09]|nr:hypothetical protein PM04_15610 [Thalassobacter sp. 16PALIMAR09]